jgi:tetratricopeptide (TPR) repeat protein
MKPIFLIRCLCAALILGSAVSVGSDSSLAVPPQLAQAQSNYNQYMQSGYRATRQGNYSAALNYFKQALQVRPGDRYATSAMRNIESYIARDRRSGNRRKTYVTYIPTNLGFPSRPVPGATRGSQNRRSESGAACIQGEQSLTAITPSFDISTKTTAANPAFFFYVPQTTAPVIELVLLDDQENLIYQKTLPAPTKAGIVSLNLPAKADTPSLQVGKTYQWSFSLVCDRRDRNSDYIVSGSITRIAPDSTLMTELEKAQPSEKAAIYAMSGLWEDSLAILAQLRQSSPTDVAIKSDWEDLLRSGGLEAIATEPLVPCCTLQ